MTKSRLRALRSYYQATAEEYDDYLHEELSLQETDSFLTLLPRHFRGTVLDVACGTGRISQQLIDEGSHYVGLDLSDSMLRVLRSKIPRVSADLVCSSATQMPFRGSRFQLVTCIGLTGYFDKKSRDCFLGQVSAVIDGGGSAVIDFLRPYSKHSVQIKVEESADGNHVYLSTIKGLRVGFQKFELSIVRVKKTSRQIQFLLRKVGRKG